MDGLLQGRICEWIGAGEGGIVKIAVEETKGNKVMYKVHGEKGCKEKGK